MGNRPQLINSAAAAVAVEEAFADVDPLGPGGVVGVVVEGELVQQAAFGRASLEHSVDNTTDTVFYMASTSKQFVAASILALEADGRLDLDAPLAGILPEMSELAGDVRVHHLLHHTSGIRDKYGLAAIAGRGEDDYATDAASLRRMMLQRELNFAAGSRFMYSNSNYFLLAQAVQRIAAVPISTFAHSRFFAPLGMTSTQFRDDSGLVIRGRASGYRRGSDGAWQLAEYTLSSVGPGGVYSTVADLARWIAGLEDGRLEPADLDLRMRRTRPLLAGEPNLYGGGLMVDEMFGRRCVHHSGAVAGHTAEVLRFIDERIAVVCMTNSGSLDAPTRARKIAERLFESAAAARSDSRSDNGVEARGGVYLADDGDMLVEVVIGETAVKLLTGAQQLTLVREGASPLRLPGGRALVFDDDGFTLEGPPSMRFHSLEGAATAPSPQLLCGEYRSPELETTAVVSWSEGALRIHLGTQDGVLEWAGGGVHQLRMPDGSTLIGRFGPGEGGAATELLLSASRATNVRFSRTR